MLTIKPQQFLEKIVSFLDECKGPNFNQEYFEKNIQLILCYTPRIGKCSDHMTLTIFAILLHPYHYEITITFKDEQITAQITDCSEAIKIKNSENYLSSKTTPKEFIPDIKEYELQLANALGW